MKKDHKRRYSQITGGNEIGINRHQEKKKTEEKKKIIFVKTKMEHAGKRNAVQSSLPGTQDGN